MVIKFDIDSYLVLNPLQDRRRLRQSVGRQAALQVDKEVDQMTGRWTVQQIYQAAHWWAGLQVDKEADQMIDRWTVHLSFISLLTANI